jgi:dTMP kinase
MRKRLKQGLFITFEGGEGLGKTTQADLLEARLREEYVGVIRSKEPGGTSLGKKLRELLLHSDEPIDPAAELLMMIADRAQHVSTLILPALEEGQIVICDRYADSTLAYQGGGRGWPTEDLERLHKIATGNLWPDLTFVLKGEPHRARGTDSFERLGDDFHTRVQRVYDTMDGSVAWPRPERFHAIAAEREREVIAAEIFGIVEPLLSERL